MKENGIDTGSSGAAAAIDNHAGQDAVHDVTILVKVKHADGGHLSRRATGTRGPSRGGLLHEVCVWVLLHEDEWTLAGAVVGFVPLRSNDPVPAEFLKVHGQGVAAAADF